MAGLMIGSIFKNCDTSRRLVILSLGLGSLLMLGCAQPITSQPTTMSQTMPKTTAQPESQIMPQPEIKEDFSLRSQAYPKVNSNLAQFLPIAATAMIANRKVDLEVTRSVEEQARGLMYRPALADDKGMLFDFMPARPVAFWMKNVPVKLDMVFILDGKVMAISHSAPPCIAEPCSVYPTEGVIADRVIELRSGWAKEYGLKVGDRVVITPKK